MYKILWLNLIDGASGSGDDEDDCPAGRYLCRLSRDCIPESWLCDTENDCGNWEDESVSMCGKLIFEIPQG